MLFLKSQLSPFAITGKDKLTSDLTVRIWIQLKPPTKNLFG